MDGSVNEYLSTMERNSMEINKWAGPWEHCVAIMRLLKLQLWKGAVRASPSFPYILWVCFRIILTFYSVPEVWHSERVIVLESTYKNSNLSLLLTSQKTKFRPTLYGSKALAFSLNHTVSKTVWFLRSLLWYLIYHHWNQFIDYSLRREKLVYIVYGPITLLDIFTSILSYTHMHVIMCTHSYI